MSAEAMDRSYQQDAADDLAHERAIEQAEFDALYSDLEHEPDTTVRGLP